MSKAHTKSMAHLMEQYQQLPGIGPRSAERLAYHVLRQPKVEALALAQAIERVKSKINFCRRCYNLSEQELCEICRDQRRDQSIICVVHQHTDLIGLEETGKCNWVYHVLLGRLAPLDGVTPDHLTINALEKRVRAGGIAEVVMATDPNIDGDGTALYISSVLRETGVKITRLARGLPAGSSIGYANKAVLTDAITGRAPME